MSQLRKRRNGELYYPRRITDDLTDVDMFLKAQKLRQHTVLKGPPGTGKSAGSEAAFDSVGEFEDWTPERRAEQTMYMVSGTSSTDISDFVGSYVQDLETNKYVWHHGPLVLSVIHNAPLLVDEIALIDPKVLSVLYPLMDGRGVLEVTQNPSLPPFHLSDEPGWFVIGTYNPDVIGAYMSEALLDRFSHNIEVETDWDLARQLGVPDNLVTIAENLNISRRKGEIRYSPQMRALLDFRTMQTEFGLQYSLKNLVSKMPEDDRPELIRALKSDSVFRKYDISTLMLQGSLSKHGASGDFD